MQTTLTSIVRRRADTALGHTYRVRLSDLNDTELKKHTESLTMQPQSYMATATSFDAYTVTPTELHVPRFYGLRYFGRPEKDELTGGTPTDVAFEGRLNETQQPVVRNLLAMLKNDGGAICVRKCGGGKTVIGLFVAASLRTKTIVFVHKSFLLDQWEERIATFLPSARVGRIQQHRVDIENKDIVIAMIQSVAQRAYPLELFDCFGLAIFDECHHIAARVFFSVLRKIRTSYVLGLTATEQRSDGLTRLLNFGLGEFCTAASSSEGASHDRATTQVLVDTFTHHKPIDICRRDGQFSVPTMISNISAEPSRNLLVSRHIVRAFHEKRHVIVLSDRIAQLEILLNLVQASGVPSEHVAFFVGSTPKKERAAVSTRSVILATYALCKEGLDIASLDTLIMATPSGNVEQAVGRIQRPSETKQRPLVVDIVDTNSIVFRNMARRRSRFYQQRHFETI